MNHEEETAVIRRIADLITRNWCDHSMGANIITIRHKPRHVWMTIENGLLIFFVRDIWRRGYNVPTTNQGRRFRGRCVTHKLDLSHPRSLVSTELRRVTREAAKCYKEEQIIEWVRD